MIAVGFDKREHQRGGLYIEVMQTSMLNHERAKHQLRATVWRVEGSMAAQFLREPTLFYHTVP